MKRLVSLTMAVAVTLLWSGFAVAQSALIPRIAPVQQSARQTFTKLKNHFSSPVASGNFQLVSANETTGTIVAKRSGIDIESWGEWAYCKMGPMQMLDSLQDGSVTVKVQVQPSGAGACYVRVTADFEGTYGIGSQQSTTQCASNGVLENQILSVAGARVSQ